MSRVTRSRRVLAEPVRARSVSRFHAGESYFDDSTDAADSWSVPRVVAVSPPELDTVSRLYSPPIAVGGLFSSRPAPEFAPGSTRLRLLAYPKGSVAARARSRAVGLSVLQVDRPRAVSMCVSRQVRKSVLFARGVAGRRGSAPGPYRRNVFSNYRC